MVQKGRTDKKILYIILVFILVWFFSLLGSNFKKSDVKMNDYNCSIEVPKTS